jgi:hypothetical protein
MLKTALEAENSGTNMKRVGWKEGTYRNENDDRIHHSEEKGAIYLLDEEPRIRIWKGAHSHCHSLYTDY